MILFTAKEAGLCRGIINKFIHDTITICCTFELESLLWSFCHLALNLPYNRNGMWHNRVLNLPYIIVGSKTITEALNSTLVIFKALSLPYITTVKPVYSGHLWAKIS